MKNTQHFGPGFSSYRMSPSSELNQNETAKLLSIILLGAVVFGSTTLLVLLILNYELRPSIVLLVVGMLGTALALRILLLRGHQRQATILYAIVPWLLIAALSIFSGVGVRSAAFLFLVAQILITGFAVNLRASVISTTATILLGIFLVWQVQSDLQISGTKGLIATNDAVFLVVIIPLFLLAPLLVWAAQQAFANSSRQNQTAERARREAEVFRQRTVSLEDRVEARTRELRASLERERLLAAHLRSALDEETRLRQLQAHIIDVVLHEFRTPLTVISNALDLLHEFRTTLTPERAAAIHDRGSEGVFSLARMLEETAVAAQANSASIPILARDLAFEELADMLESATRSLCGDRPLEFQRQEQTNHEQRLHQDPALLADVLAALIDNALKYSPEPASIRVACRATDGRLTLVVEDEGIGIPENEQATIGDLLTRGSNARYVPGLGLSLYIAQRRVAAMGGTLTISSPGQNQGATAVVAVPAHVPETLAGDDNQTAL